MTIYNGTLTALDESDDSASDYLQWCTSSESDDTLVTIYNGTLKALDESDDTLVTIYNGTLTARVMTP